MTKKRSNIRCLNCNAKVRSENEHFIWKTATAGVWTCKPK